MKLSKTTQATITDLRELSGIIEDIIPLLIALDAAEPPGTSNGAPDDDGVARPVEHDVISKQQLRAFRAKTAKEARRLRNDAVGMLTLARRVERRF